MTRRRPLLAAAGTLLAAPATLAWSQATREPSAAEAAAWAALRTGAVLLLRHALAPGVGDPPGFRLGDCATQRNLDDTGREQARALGQRLRAQGVVVGAVWSSRWCRALETARLLDAGPVREEPAFDSLYGSDADSRARTEAARALLRAWQGPGALVVVSHQVNLTALSGGGAASAEGLVLQRRGADLQLVGRLQPP